MTGVGMTGAPILELRDLAKVYESRQGRTIGVEGVSLTVRPGEILGLLGPNGAGKTTLLKMAALLSEPTSGDIYFDGVAARSAGMAQLLQFKRRLGYLPESPFVFNLLTGREYLTFIGELYGVERRELGPRIERTMDALDLGEAQDMFLRAFSQGMLKKLSFAAALLHDPAVLLLDEPTNSLDPRMIVKVRDLLAQERAAGKAILLSTHILDVAEKLSDRVAILHRGHLVRVVSLDETRDSRPEAGRSPLEDLFLEATG
jgi:ABC-2 type transport system ATP-binding protein